MNDERTERSIRQMLKETNKKLTRLQDEAQVLYHLEIGFQGWLELYAQDSLALDMRVMEEV